MRWKAHFFLKEDSNDETKQERESYGFKTRKCHLNAKKWKTSKRT